MNAPPMNVHCFPISGFAAEAPKMRFSCTRCGCGTARSVEDLMEAYGEDSSLAEILSDLSCRDCGGAYMIAAPDWPED